MYMCTSDISFITPNKHQLESDSFLQTTQWCQHTSEAVWHISSLRKTWQKLGVLHGKEHMAITAQGQD